MSLLTKQEVPDSNPGTGIYMDISIYLSIIIISSSSSDNTILIELIVIILAVR